ncbi:MAG: hypothetical protein QM773_18760 [Hyphomonadaceae bacterium]
MRLLLDRDRVDVGGVGRERHRRAAPARLVDHLPQKEVRALRTFDVEDPVERFEPLACLVGIRIARVIHRAPLLWFRQMFHAAR